MQLVIAHTFMYPIWKLVYKLRVNPLFGFICWLNVCWPVGSVACLRALRVPDMRAFFSFKNVMKIVQNKNKSIGCYFHYDISYKFATFGWVVGNWFVSVRVRVWAQAHILCAKSIRRKSDVNCYNPSIWLIETSGNRQTKAAQGGQWWSQSTGCYA